MSVLHINIHSITKHIDDFRTFLVRLKNPFDFICISESKIQKGIEPIVDIRIPGFQAPERTDTECIKGGVLIYVREGISYKLRKDLLMYKPKELESIFLEVINKKGPNDIIGNVYRHPSMNVKEFNENYLPTFLERVSKGSKKIYISGDFNFDMLNIGKHSETADFFDSMMNNFLLPSINKPTKINSLSNTLIDNIFTNDIHPDSISGNLTVNFSDGHLPSFLFTPKSSPASIPKQHNLMVRNMNNLDENALLADCDLDWDTILDINRQDVDYSTENMLKSITEVVDRHAPLRRKTVSEIKQSFKPWITNGILQKIKLKDKLYKKYTKSKNEVTRSIHLTNYKKLNPW